MNVAVILAGGVGNRVGADIPKQFIEVFDKPILAYTIETFQNHQGIDAIEVVCIKSYMDYMNQMKETYGFTKLRWIAEGGNTFQESVLNGVNHLKNKVSGEDIVLVHFGASPFVSEDIITDAIRVCAIKGNAISTTDFYLLSGIKETMDSVQDPDNSSSKYISRDSIACMNSPHAFKYQFLKDLYDEAIETGVINEVEPYTTAIMYALNKPIYFSKGSQTNIKITYQEDVGLFEGWLLMKERRAKIEEGVLG